jgi:SAM-dependent methyltransferase
LNSVQIKGVDVLVRQPSRIPVAAFDGGRLPYADRAFDFVLLVDVLHHTDNPEALLKECLRVSRKFVLIKDHLCNSRLDNWILRSMDWIGNRPYGVALTYNYLSSTAWSNLFSKLGLSEDYRQTKLHLYPFPFSLIFDANLHFVARLRS